MIKTSSALLLALVLAGLSACESKPDDDDKMWAGFVAKDLTPAKASGKQSASEVPAGDWIADSTTGCKVRNEKPEAGESITWSGGCIDGYADGDGVLQWFKSGKLDVRFEGHLSHGLAQGHGTFTTANGDRFIGEFKDNQRNGYGVTVFHDGGRVEGEFHDGEMTGRARVISPNGNRYDGQLVDGKNEGYGVFTWPDGHRYEGEWHDGKPNGRGTYTSDRAYTGQWTNGCARIGGMGIAVATTMKECGFE